MDLDPLLLSRLQFLPSPSFSTSSSRPSPSGCRPILRRSASCGCAGASSTIVCSRGSGPRSSLCPSPWAWCRGSFCHTNSAPIGAASRTTSPTRSTSSGSNKAAASSPRSMLPRADGAARPCSGGYVQSGSYCVPKSERSAPATPTIAAAVELTRLVEI
jgi:hypothetical protein